MHAELVNEATPCNENITMGELQKGSFDKEDRMCYSDEEWYKKSN